MLGLRGRDSISEAAYDKLLIITLAKVPRWWQLRRDGLGWVAASVASCLLASHPGADAPLLESHASAARAGQGSAGKNTSRGARAAFGGVRLGAAGCCKRRGEHVRALGCVPSALQRTFPCASRGRLCSSGRALSQRATGLHAEQAARQTAKTHGEDEWHT